MIANIAAAGRASRGRFGEVAGHVQGLHELRDNGRLVIRLVPRDGGRLRMVRADRTQYFAVRRLLTGEYDLHCGAVFGGVYNDLYLGMVAVKPGLTLVHGRAHGSVVRGTVLGCRRPVPVNSRIELRRKEHTGPAHASLLDRFSRFFFTGLVPGDYVLTGHVPGNGTVGPLDVRVAGSESRLDPLFIDRVPVVRIGVRGVRRDSMLRRFRVVVHAPDGSLHPDGVAVTDSEVVVETPSAGRTRYRIEATGASPVLGDADADPAERIEVTPHWSGVPRSDRIVTVRWS